MINSAIERIIEQQKGFDEFSTVYQVGEQLKDICQESPEEAELIFQDLNNKSMSIVEAEKKIKAFADKHKKGNSSCCPPKEADRILREFYGLEPKQYGKAETKAKPENKTVNLADFFN